MAILKPDAQFAKYVFKMKGKKLFLIMEINTEDMLTLLGGRTLETIPKIKSRQAKQTAQLSETEATDREHKEYKYEL